MDDLLVDKEQWIILDLGKQSSGTQPIGTQPTGTQSIGTQTTSTQSTSSSKEDWEKLDRRESGTIQLCLENLVLLNVLGEYTTKE
jgi:hypothetical protein